MIGKPTSLTPVVQRTRSPTLGSRIFEMCPNLTLFARHRGESVSPFFTSQIAHGLRWATCRRSWYLRPYLSGSTSHCRHAAWASQGETMPGWCTRIQGSETKSQSETTWLHQTSPRQAAHFIRFSSLKVCKAQSLMGRWVPATTNRPLMALFNLRGVTSSWPFGLSTSTCVRSISSPMSLSMLTPSFSTCAASTLDVSWSLMILRRVKL